MPMRFHGGLPLFDTANGTPAMSADCCCGELVDCDLIPDPCKDAAGGTLTLGEPSLKVGDPTIVEVPYDYRISLPSDYSLKVAGLTLYGTPHIEDWSQVDECNPWQAEITGGAPLATLVGDTLENGASGKNGEIALVGVVEIPYDLPACHGYVLKAQARMCPTVHYPDIPSDYTCDYWQTELFCVACMNRLDLPDPTATLHTSTHYYAEVEALVAPYLPTSLSLTVDSRWCYDCTTDYSPTRVQDAIKVSGFVEHADGVPLTVVLDSTSDCTGVYTGASSYTHNTNNVPITYDDVMLGPVLINDNIGCAWAADYQDYWMHIEGRANLTITAGGMELNTSRYRYLFFGGEFGVSNYVFTPVIYVDYAPAPLDIEAQSCDTYDFTYDNLPGVTPGEDPSSCTNPSLRAVLDFCTLNVTL